MNLFGMMDASGEAMQAERMRAEVVAANMANAETTRTEAGGPYHRQMVVFAADRGDANFLGSPSFSDSMHSAANGIALPDLLPGSNLPPLPSLPGSGNVAPGVEVAQVIQDPSPPLKRYDPGHPDAGPDGYVAYPDINPLTEMVDLMGATRAYGLNGSAVQAEKSMITSALDIAKA
jgi:flagellar basal-body rod protein FlgC